MSDIVRCDYCERELDGAEIESPYCDDHMLCDECWEEVREDYEFDCPCCFSPAPKSEMGELGSLFVLFEQVGRTPPGLYAILEHPFYVQPLVGRATIWEECVQRLGGVPDEADGYDGAAYLCRDCSRRLLGRRTLRIQREGWVEIIVGRPRVHSKGARRRARMQEVVA